MRNDLDHLPQTKQQELAHVVRVLFEAFEAAQTRRNQKWNKQARILKLVLYGSYARGGWVDDPVSGYTSDYDILIVVNDEHLVDFEYWSAAEDRLMRDMTITGTLSAPVNFIVHSLSDVNRQLEKGRPFFIDIVRDGIPLYEAEGFCFTQPRDLPEDEARAEAQAHFTRWYSIAQTSLQTFKLQRAEGNNVYWRNDAAFTLHQAVERAYHCVLLTLTLYSPKSHKLNFLRGHAEAIAPALIEAWPRDDKFSRRCFELLRQAYVNARYSEQYSVSDEELDWLGERIAILQQLVEQVCQQRLAQG